MKHMPWEFTTKANHASISPYWINKKDQQNGKTKKFEPTHTPIPTLKSQNFN